MVINVLKNSFILKFISVINVYFYCVKTILNHWCYGSVVRTSSKILFIKEVLISYQKPARGGRWLNNFCESVVALAPASSFLFSALPHSPNTAISLHMLPIPDVKRKRRVGTVTLKTGKKQLQSQRLHGHAKMIPRYRHKEHSFQYHVRDSEPFATTKYRTGAVNNG